MKMNRRETRRRAPRLCQWRDMEEVEKFANEAIRCYVDDSFDQTAVLAHVYGRLIFQVRLSEKLGKHEGLLPPIRHALDIIENHYALPLRLKQIAGAAGWSVAHFHEVFRSHMGVSPHQELLRRRIRRARELLSSTDLSIKQVASESGFSTAASFGHAFKSRVGMTPGAFRLQVTGQLAAAKIQP
jgi:AraC-like DNA-binding protein